jgi:hypothetical protein
VKHRYPVDAEFPDADIVVYTSAVDSVFCSPYVIGSEYDRITGKNHRRWGLQANPYIGEHIPVEFAVQAVEKLIEKRIGAHELLLHSRFG